MLEAVINAMQVIHAAIPGVTWAPELQEFPGKLEAAQLPAVLPWPTAATWDEPAIGIHRNDIELQVSVFVEAVGNQGYRGDTIATAVQLMDDFRLVYLDYQDISTLGGTVEHISEVAVSGLREITLAGIAYYGFQMTFTAVLKEIP